VENSGGEFEGEYFTPEHVPTGCENPEFCYLQFGLFGVE